MGMWVKEAGAWKWVLKPLPKEAGAWREPDRMFYKVGGKWELVWPAPAKITITGTSPYWDTINLSWVPSGPAVSHYTVIRDGVVIVPSTTSLAFVDTGLLPGTTYTYTIKGYRDGLVSATSTQPVATIARADMGLVSSAIAYDRATLTWTDPSGRVDSYRLMRGQTQVYAGPLMTFTDTGLTSDTGYTYTVEAVRGGATMPPADTLLVTTGARPAMTLNAVASGWDTVNLTWTDTAADADTYVLQRASTAIGGTIAGAARSYSDAGVLMPSTSYTYTLTAKRGGVNVGSVTDTVTTGAHPDLGLSSTVASYSQINLAWSAKNGSVTTFELKRGSTVIYNGAGTSFNDTGLAESTAYSYTLTAKRSSTAIKTDTTSKTTSARPTSSGSIAGPATGNASWTECTEKALSGVNVSMPVTGYVTGFNIAARGYGDGGRVNPHLDGAYLGWRACDTSSSSYPSLDWTDVGVANKGWGAGAHSIGANVGGDCNKTQWYAHSGGAYGSNICWGQVNYWYYSSLERDAELRQHPWWVEEMAGRALHIASTVDGSGETVKVVVTDKRTKAVLVDWEA